VQPARRLQGAWLLRTCGAIGGSMMAEVTYTGNEIRIQLPGLLLILTKAEFRRAWKRGKAYQRHSS
jgi:hypothetical protein